MVDPGGHCIGEAVVGLIVKVAETGWRESEVGFIVEAAEAS